MIMAKGVFILYFSLTLAFSMVSLYSARIDSSIKEQVYNSAGSSKDATRKIPQSASNAGQNMYQSASDIPRAANNAAHNMQQSTSDIHKEANNAAHTIKNKGVEVPKAANHGAPTKKHKSAEVPKDANSAGQYGRDAVERMPKVVNDGAQYVKDKVKEIPRDVSNTAGTIKHNSKEMFGSPSPAEPTHNKPKQIHKYVNPGAGTPQDTQRVTNNVAGTVNGKENEILPKTAPHYTFRDATGNAEGAANGKEKKILPKTSPYTYRDATGHAEPPTSFKDWAKDWLGHENKKQQAKNPKVAPGHRYMEITVEDPKPAYIDNMEGHGYMEVMPDNNGAHTIKQKVVEVPKAANGVGQFAKDTMEKMPKVVSNGAQYVKDKVKEIPQDVSNVVGTMKHKGKEMFGSPSPSEFAHNKPKQIHKYVNHGPRTTQDTHRVTNNLAGTVNGKEKEIPPKTAPHYTFRDATDHATGTANGKEREILPKTAPYTFRDATGHAEAPTSFKHWLGHGNQQQEAKTAPKSAPGHRYMEITIEDPEPAYINNMEGHGYMEVMPDNHGARTIKHKDAEVPKAANDVSQSVKDTVEKMPKVVSNGAQYVKDKVKEIPQDVSNAGSTMKHKGKEMFGSPSPSEFAHNKPKQIHKYVNHGPRTTQDTHRVTNNVARTVNGKEKEILPKTAPHYTFRDATGHTTRTANSKEREILPKTAPYTFRDATGHAEAPTSFKHWLGHGNQHQQAKTAPKAAPGHRYMELIVEDPEPAYINNMEGHRYMEVMPDSSAQYMDSTLEGHNYMEVMADAPTPYMNPLEGHQYMDAMANSPTSYMDTLEGHRYMEIDG